MIGRFRQFLEKITLTEKLLYLYIILIPVMRVPYLPLLGQKIQYSDLIFLALFSIFLAQLLKQRRDFLSVPLWLPLACLLVLPLFSFFNSAYLLKSGIEFAGILYLVCLYALLCQLVDSLAIWWRLIICWCIVSLLITFTGIIAYFFSAVYGIQSFLMVNHDYLLNIDNHLAYRLCSVFRHPAMLTIYLHASIVFGFILAAKKEHGITKYAGYLVIALSFIAAILTKTRDLAGIALTVAIVLACMPKKNIYIAIARYLSFLYAFILMGYVVSSVIWWVFPVKIQSNPAGQNISVELNTIHSTHYVRYKTMSRMIKDHPWVGVGLGMYNYRSADYIKWEDVKDTYHVVYPQITKQDEDSYKKGIDPHSLYMGFGAETGLLGLCGLLFFFWQLISRFVRKIKTERDIVVRYTATVLLAGLLGFMFNGLYIDMLSIRSFWFLIAMGVIYIRL